MALGTPVAGAAAYGTTPVSPAYPAGILATDIVLLFVGQKPTIANSGTVTTPTGWTLREELIAAGGYGTTLGADTGNTNLRVYSWNSPVAGQTGNLAVTTATTNIAWAFIVRIPTGGGTKSYGSADGQRTTTPTSPMSIALTNGATATNFQTGDLAIWAMCIPTDVTTPSQFSAQSVTATGATFATAVELNEPDSATGNDIGGYSAYASVSSGSSTTAPTVTATLAGTLTNVRGPVVLLRLREAQAISFDAAVGTFTYTGQDAALTRTEVLDAEVGTFSYTGQDADLTKTVADKVIDAEVGSFTLTGQDATLTRTEVLNAEVGSFTLTGQDATLTRTEVLNAEAGTFSYTGQDATLTRTEVLNAEVGTFVLTGQDATLTRTEVLNAEVGAFVLTGQDATLVTVSAQGLDAEEGTFLITGQAATLVRALSFNAQAGTFTLTGQAATLSIARNLNAEAGTFTLTGQAATLTKTLVVDAQAGSFALTGSAATFVRTRVLTATAAAFDEGPDQLYVDSNYVNPGYVTGLTATLARTYMFSAGSGTFLYTGQNATFSVAAAYPLPADVRAGVVYGPGGIYTGTLVATKAIYLFDD